LRGFEYAGIGPRDLTSPNQDALGGDHYVKGTLDLATPLPVPQEFGLVGHIFSDAGILGHTGLTPIPGNTLVDDDSLHLSVGIGIAWASPFGPVRLDLAEPLIYKSYDKLQHVHFNFGTKF
jgi:outer membrane protein insertion porin family